MGDPLSDCSPLISAAALGKLRLVRLLLEGGAQVNGRNPRGETAILAACKALRGEPTGPETVKLLTYLLQNKADPNAQDRAGRTPLMYACMERAGAQVASTLLAAGADPSMEDYSGASALVYAINAQHQPTLKVLMDACRAKGRDIIIIATEMDVNGGPVTRRYLNVPPSPDTSPVSCMSPSDIVLKTGSPNSPEGENIFNFRGTSKRGSSSRNPPCDLSPMNQSGAPPPRQRMLSEPWLAIHNLACLNRAYEEGMRERSLQDKGDREDLRREGGRHEDEEREDEDEKANFHQSRMDWRRGSTAQRRDNRYGGLSYNDFHEDFFPRVSQSLISLTEVCSSQAAQSRLAPERHLASGGSTSDRMTPKSCVDKLPACFSRRNTLPSVTVVPPPLHLPPLVSQSESHLQVPAQLSLCRSTNVEFHPHPPSPSPSSPSSRASVRPALLPLVAPPASPCSDKGRKSLRRHSVQLDQIRGEETTLSGL
ncbi:ankyrin repeat domain-containing protein 34B [Myripristis murdjan]|uniref:ankyrin repeat domain-containing protein 34B n=1 Tax=Myripristis murdjan TaxID=586833 RepID=UPI001175C90B|nr:ankyrin repeat domain-containing protein 34B-like [Myripristis murdjan]